MHLVTLNKCTSSRLESDSAAIVIQKMLSSNWGRFKSRYSNCSAVQCWTSWFMKGHESPSSLFDDRNFLGSFRFYSSNCRVGTTKVPFHLFSFFMDRPGLPSSWLSSRRQNVIRSNWTHSLNWSRCNSVKSVSLNRTQNEVKTLFRFRMLLRVHGTLSADDQWIKMELNTIC